MVSWFSLSDLEKKTSTLIQGSDNEEELEEAIINIRSFLSEQNHILTIFLKTIAEKKSPSTLLENVVTRPPENTIRFDC